MLRKVRQRHLLVGLALLGTMSGWAEANAATIPFTFRVTGLGTIDSPPSPASPAVGTTLMATGEFSPFGTAAYSEVGTLTFGFFSPEVFAIQSLANRFTASFNAGADTFSGTVLGIFQAPEGMAQAFTLNLTIESGTGLFRSAAGQATATGIGQPDSDVFSGSGQISAPSLNPAPEPSTCVLFATGIFALAAIAERRKRENRPRWPSLTE